MTEHALKLTAYFGERDRHGERLLADALADLFARRGVARSLVLRGIEGFGPRQHLHTDRLLSLSEDLPLVAIALGDGAQMQRLASAVRALRFDGLVTLERVALGGPGMEAVELPGAGEARLTLHLGRHDRAAGGPAHRAVVDALHDHHVAGATVLLGVDGTAGAIRERARLLGRNDRVPAMVVSVGVADRLADALDDLRALVPRAVATVERVRVLRRDGLALAAPEQPPPGDRSWQRITVYAGTQSRHQQAVLHDALIHRLRAARAAGATTVRGVWGYHGDDAPHGDVAWRLRRRVPVVTTAIDDPSAVRRWWPVVEEVTAETGLVTEELVPVALHA